MEDRVFASKPCPLLCLVAASNELPEDAASGGELSALYDRFLLRFAANRRR
jgi:hypothetical protein